MHEQQYAKSMTRWNCRHGARVRVVTTLDRDEKFRNSGVLPLTEYLERKGYDATGVVKSPLLIERLDEERVFLPLAWLYEWRQHLEAEFATTFSAETAGVLEAALLGNRFNISRDAAERFRAGGTFHVLVISGLQIAFYCWPGNFRSSPLDPTKAFTVCHRRRFHVGLYNRRGS